MLDGMSDTAPSGAPPAALATIASLLVCQAEYQQLGTTATYNLEDRGTLLRGDGPRESGVNP